MHIEGFAASEILYPYRTSVSCKFLLSFSGIQSFVKLYPFTAPKVTPLTKYFWIKGYTHMIGAIIFVVKKSTEAEVAFQ